MTSKADQKAQTHERILDSAARIVSERGVSGASVASVMKGAGLTVGGFYAHFKDKAALVEQAILRSAAASRAFLFGGLESHAPDERLAVVLERYLSGPHRDAPSRGCCFPAVVGEVGTTAPEHADVLAQTVETYVDELRALSSDPSSEHSREDAIATIALMIGGLSLARALRDTPLSDEVLRACRAAGQALNDDDRGRPSKRT